MRLAIMGSTVQRILPMGLFHVLSVLLGGLPGGLRPRAIIPVPV